MRIALTGLVCPRSRVELTWRCYCLSVNPLTYRCTSVLSGWLTPQVVASPGTVATLSRVHEMV
jgi:hypothetical protein